ncbi:MAG: hypothetical protein JW923_09570 [Spirochaetales bacterium]|nr:hypothetical protein [Spirochaetales bacterium]
MIRLAATRAAMIALAATVLLPCAAQVSPTATPLYKINESLGGVTYTLRNADYGPFGAVLGQPAFSPSYSSWILPVLDDNGKLVLIVNGKEVQIGQKARNADGWAISDDGRTYAGRVELDTGSDHGEPQYLLVANGKAYGPYAQVELRSLGSSWLAWGEVRQRNKASAFTLLIGDKIYGPYEEIWDAEFDPRSGQPLVVAVKKGKTYLVGGGRETGPWERADILRSRDGRMLGAIVGDSRSMTAMIGNASYGPYENIGRIWTSDNGASVAFDAWKNDQSYLVRDGKETLVDWVDIMSESGLLIYVAQVRGKHYIVVGDREYGPYPSLRSRFAPPGGVWAVEVEVARGSSAMGMIVTSVGEFPGQDLRCDGTTYTWIALDEAGVASLMRLEVVQP